MDQVFVCGLMLCSLAKTIAVMAKHESAFVASLMKLVAVPHEPAHCLGGVFQMTQCQLQGFLIVKCKSVCSVAGSEGYSNPQHCMVGRSECNFRAWHLQRLGKGNSMMFWNLTAALSLCAASSSSNTLEQVFLVTPIAIMASSVVLIEGIDAWPVVPNQEYLFCMQLPCAREWCGLVWRGVV